MFRFAVTLTIVCCAFHFWMSGTTTRGIQLIPDFCSSCTLVHSLMQLYVFTAIHSKNLVAIVYLLVALAMHFQGPVRLPEHVSVQVVVVKVRSTDYSNSYSDSDSDSNSNSNPIRLDLIRN